MKYVDEYRGGAEAARYAEAIRRLVTRPWTVMEVCGGQTHAIVRFGIDALLPPEVTLLHGPGCPVCVTPIEIIDRAIYIAARPEVIFCSYGDMLRVPGTEADLLSARASGADVRIVYSAMDALDLARKNPDRRVVFFGVGFETTAPGHAMAVFQAKQQRIDNFSLLSAHVRVPPALLALLGEPDAAPGTRRVDAFLAAGHVCTIMGSAEYEPIAARYRVPIVITGFEPLDLLDGLHRALAQLEAGRAEVENQYARAVRREGNEAARRILAEVFEVADASFRGIGEIPESGLRLRDAYAAHDASLLFDAPRLAPRDPGECLSGLVLKGEIKPTACPAFGTRCTPERPLGATMVSSEGACAAYFRYRRGEIAS
ncbi:MAG: hydrogenase formation protein HypD [Byssovorax sp.]